MSALLTGRVASRPRNAKPFSTPRFNSEDLLTGDSARHRAVPALPSVLPMDDSDPFEGPPDDQRRIDYLPTPDEIVNACAMIRSQWTMSEKRRRFVGDCLPDEEDHAWQPPVIDTSQFRISNLRADATR